MRVSSLLTSELRVGGDVQKRIIEVLDEHEVWHGDVAQIRVLLRKVVAVNKTLAGQRQDTLTDIWKIWKTCVILRVGPSAVSSLELPLICEASAAFEPTQELAKDRALGRFQRRRCCSP